MELPAARRERGGRSRVFLQGFRARFRLEQRWLLSEYREEVECYAEPPSPRGRLMSRLQEMELRLRGRRMCLR
ncbi:unnamed protein product [Prunus brigantina]